MATNNLNDDRKFVGVYYRYGRRIIGRGNTWTFDYISLFHRHEVPYREWQFADSEEEVRKGLTLHAEKHIFGDTGCDKFLLRQTHPERNITIDLIEKVHVDRLNYIFSNPDERGDYNLSIFRDYDQEQLMKERAFAGASWILSQPCQDAIAHEITNNNLTREQAIEVLYQYIISKDEPVAIDTNCDLNIPVVLVETETLEEKGARNFIVPGTFPDNAFFIKRITVLDFNDWTATYQIFTDNAPGDGTASLPAVEGLPGSDFYIQPNQYVVITVTDTAGNVATKRIDYPVMEDNSEDSNEQDEGE